jgi:hypothetical protein
MKNWKLDTSCSLVCFVPHGIDSSNYTYFVPTVKFKPLPFAIFIQFSRPLYLVLLCIHSRLEEMRRFCYKTSKIVAALSDQSSDPSALEY